MATAYTPILKLALPVTGELNGTWGDVVNQNITEMVEQAVAGLATINTWTTNSHTLTTANGTTSESRCAMLVIDDDGAGNPSAAATVICPTATKSYIVRNLCGQTVTVKTAAGTGVAVPNNQAALVFCDGTNVVTGAFNGDVVGPATATNNAIVTFDGTTGKLIKDNSGATISAGVITATGLSAAQVDITAQGDLRLQDTTGGEFVALQAPGTLATSYTLTLPVDDGTSGQALITDGSGVLSWSTAASGDVYGPASATDNAIARFDGTTGKIIQNSSVILDDSNNVSGVVQLNATTVDTTNIEVTNLKAKDGTAAGSIADATGIVTLASSVLTTTDINGGTIDGTTIGASSASTGSFTTLTTSSTVTLNGGTANGVAYLNGSKALTTGSDLTFDGARLRLTHPSSELILNNTTGDYLFLTSFANGAYIDNRITGNMNFRGDGNFLWSVFGGSEQMRLTTTGLGIGTSSPAYKLDVSLASGSTLARFSGPEYSQVIVTDGIRSMYQQVYDNEARLFTSSATPLLFGTNNVERMRLTAAGDVGIGTSVPAAKLDVRDVNRTNASNLANINVYSTSSQAADLGGTIALGGVFGSSGSAPFGSIRGGKQNSTNDNYDGYLAFQTIANGGVLTERMRLNSAGSLGIGTTTPSKTGQRAITINDSTLPILEFAVADLLSGYIYSNDTQMTLDTGRVTPITFLTNGVERMRLTAAGDLGLGTTSPTNKLTVSNGTSRTLIRAASDLNFAGAYLGTATSANRGASLELLTHFDGSQSGGWRLGVSIDLFGGTADLVFGISGASSTYAGLAYTERMRLDVNGNLGLGVTPSAWFSNRKAIDIGGAVSAVTGANITIFGNNYYTDTSGTNRYVTTSAAAQQMLFPQGGGVEWQIAPIGTAGNTISFTQAMTLDASGNLMVGTTTAGRMLTLAPISFSAGQLGGIRLINTANVTTSIFEMLIGSEAGTGIPFGSLRTGNDANAYITFFTGTGPAERMRIDSSGNVGIGTSAFTYPTSGRGLLEINGSSSALIAVKTGDTARGYFASSATITELASVGASQPLSFTTNGVERMRITASGDVGIGTSSPSQKLNVNGIALFEGSAQGNVIIQKTGTNGVALFSDAAGKLGFYDQNASTLRMVLDASGNLGIGTASPATKLDVSGAIRASTGILFGTDTAAANTLDDYEEGTWTPSVGGNATYSVQSGTYTKVGNLVHIEGKIVITVLGTGSATTVSGLPFTVLGTANGITGKGNVGYFASIATSLASITSEAINNTATFSFNATTGAVTTATNLPNIFADNARVDFAMTYISN